MTKAKLLLELFYKSEDTNDFSNLCTGDKYNWVSDLKAEKKFLISDIIKIPNIDITYDKIMPEFSLDSIQDVISNGLYITIYFDCGKDIKLSNKNIGDMSSVIKFYIYQKPGQDKFVTCDQQIIPYKLTTLANGKITKKLYLNLSWGNTSNSFLIDNINDVKKHLLSTTNDANLK